MPLVLESTAPLTEAAIQPWRRCLARCLDYAIAGVVVDAVIQILDASFFDNGTAWLFVAVFAAALWVPVEAVALATYGTTPGKAFLKLRVMPVTSLEEPATLDVTLARALRVWLGGIACAFPLICLIAMLIGYDSLRRGGATWWDQQLELAVRETGPLGLGRVVGLVLIFGALAAFVFMR